jgi:hypothetical protein
MVLLITYYLLIGLVVSFGIEHVIRWTNQDVNFWERALMITLWPIMTIIFIYNFLKGLMG